MKKKIVAALLLTLLIAGAVGSSLAYLIDKSDEIVNTFELGEIAYELILNENLPEGTTIDEGWGIQEGNLKESSQTLAAGSATFDVVNPVRAGYKFEGWYYDALGEEAFCACEPEPANEQIKVGYEYNEADSDNVVLELFAKWTPHAFKIRYNSGNLIEGLEDITQNTVSTISYSVSNGKVTVTGTRDTDNYGYINAMVYLEAGIQYKFSCDTNGDWAENDTYTVASDTVEAFLMLSSGEGYSDYVRMGSDNFLFTPDSSGTYRIRLDVNNKSTKTFEDISIIRYSAPETNHYYGVSSSISNYIYSRPEKVFLGWSTIEGGETVEYISGQDVTTLTPVDGAIIDLYPVWTVKSNAIILANGDVYNGSLAPYRGSGYEKDNSQNALKLTLQGIEDGDEGVYARLDHADYKTDQYRYLVIEYMIPKNMTAHGGFWIYPVLAEYESDYAITHWAMYGDLKKDGMYHREYWDLYTMNDIRISDNERTNLFYGKEGNPHSLTDFRIDFLTKHDRAGESTVEWRGEYMYIRAITLCDSVEACHVMGASKGTSNMPKQPECVYNDDHTQIIK